MVTPLTREQSEALRDAGLQCDTAFALDIEHGAGFCRSMTSSQWNEARQFRLQWLLACPNSDELLAAIRERWPSYILGVQHVEHTGQWCARIVTKPANQTIVARSTESPVAALAALYVALAAQEPPC